MTARSLLFAQDGRLQPPWRILLFLLVGASSIVVVSIALRPIFQALENTIGLPGVAASYAATTALLVAHWLTLRTFDKQPFAFVALDRDAARPPRLAYGWILGAAPIVLTALLLAAAGWLELIPSTPGSWWTATLQISLLLLPAAFYEELLARGYVFAVLREWLGSTAAILLTSVAFGLIHLSNPGAELLPIAVVMLAGAYLAAVLLLTRSLYAAWMAHWAWNWILAVALHIEVSGQPLGNPDYKTVETGPDWITGGKWGPEGGAVAGFGIVATLLFLYYRGKRQSGKREREVGSGKRER